MPYHAFISYAREDSAYCDEVYRILSTVFDLQVYRDTERPAVGDFMQQIRAVLTQRPVPALVVIASDHSANSKYVLDEMEEYWRATEDDAERPVLFLEIQPGTVGELGRRLARRSTAFADEELRRFQIIERDEAGPLVDEQLVDKLWLALSGNVRDRTLAENRALADGWVARSLPTDRVNFWGHDWHGMVAPLLDESSVESLVLTAEGGSGKSVISALYVRELLARENVMPVVLANLGALAPDELEPLVCSRVGVPTMRVLSSHLHRLRKRGTRTVFVVDGLDQIGRDPAVHGAFLAALRAMTDATTVLATCRPEFWSDGFSTLGCRQRDVGPLSHERVRQVLARTVHHIDFPRTDVLVVPFFLDAVIQSRDLLTTAPETETEILDLLWRKYSRGATSAVPDVASTPEVLHQLASLQLDECTYAVPRRLLDARLDDAGIDAATALNDLTSRGVLVSSWHGADALVRLRHDLLDCFGMVRRILRGDDGAQRRRQVYAQAASDIGWPVIAALAQWANDTGDTAILDEVFGALLGMLDLKRIGEAEMARAWAATYVLRGKFDVLRPYVVRCLSGEVATSVSSAADLPASRLGAKSRVTREAASSLASVFEMVDDWTAADPDAAVPVLALNLTTGRWPGFRRRFLEALTAYRSEDAIDAVLRFAEAEVRTARTSLGDADLDILPDIVTGIGELGLATRASALLDDIAAVADEVIATSASVPATRKRRLASRRILRALSHVRSPRAGSRSSAELTEEEIVDQLKPKEFAHDGTVIYTDWTGVQRAAARMRRMARTGPVSTEILSGLIGALGHEHTRARTAVAECLSDINAPESREALIATLMERSIPAELRRACLTGLLQQIPRHDATRAAARRWQLLSASARARRNEVYSSADDLRLLDGGRDADQNLVSPQAFELFRLVDGVGLCSRFANDAPIDQAARAVITAEDVRAIGADLETKYRIAAIDGASAPVAISLSETTWRESAAFHRALRRLEVDAPEKLDGLLDTWFDHHPLPGIAGVHAIVITSDRRIILTQRSTGTIYAPRRWSASFEEQVSDSDFLTEPNDVFTAAARRGFSEELGDASAVLDVEHLGAIMEMPILNPSIVSVLRLSRSFSEVLDGWHRLPQPRELAAIDAVPLADLDAGSLRHLKLHPTSEMRLAMLRQNDYR